MKQNLTYLVDMYYNTVMILFHLRIEQRAVNLRSSAFSFRKVLRQQI